MCLLVALAAKATDPYPRNQAIDIQHYLFQIELNDRDDAIEGHASITIQFKQSIPQLLLDLVAAQSDGSGMEVSSVSVDGQARNFRHHIDILTIDLPSIRPGEIKVVSIDYKGIPRDGLIIGKNKYGDRTFFGDNWPNRARHWLPTIDHPYDKAQVDFVVTAPDRYQVISNGEQIEESNLLGNRKLTHWRERIPISTKLMVIGVAPFAVQKSGEVNGKPVTTWVYQQDRNAGFTDFAVAPSVLQYFDDAIGPFAYEKLANVQSKTRFGGMENASCIFYFENAVTGLNERESLIAHEIAHQWFGDSVTENDWYHVWLSEGFATYFTNVYLEKKYGPDRLRQELSQQREKVVAFAKERFAPVIDTTLTDINRVLSTNTYQKAGWVLHMLRRELGDEVFFEGIKSYYAKFKNGNALTHDFRRVMETASGKDLRSFFDQWLRNPGHPVLSGRWKFDPKTRSVQVQIKQEQARAFRFPLELEFAGADGQAVRKVVMVESKSVNASMPLDFEPLTLVLDPDVNLLFEGQLAGK